MVESRIAVLDGDGIGPEIMAANLKVLNAVAETYGHKFEFVHAPIGWAAVDATGEAFPKETVRICDHADAILKAPVGDMARDNDPRFTPEQRPERGAILPLRKRYNTYANYRPAFLPRKLLRYSPLRPELIEDGVDILMIRELAGGIYFGEKKHGTNVDRKKYASDTMMYTEPEVERIARVAFREAKARNTILYNVQKQNILECGVFWNEIVEGIARDEFPTVPYTNLLVDNAAFQIQSGNLSHGVILADNMMGDILSDQLGGVVGSLGLMPTACVGPVLAYYEPAHGAANSLAGQNKANPIAMILSGAMMLEVSFCLKKEAEAIRKAVYGTLEAGIVTKDLDRPFFKAARIVGTSEFGDIIAKEVLHGKQKLLR